MLQNLFFATLNTAIDKRDFSAESNRTHRDFSKYRYRKLLTDPQGFLDKLKTVPFVNGGLFDCLDAFEGAKQSRRRIDAITDNPAKVYNPLTATTGRPHRIDAFTDNPAQGRGLDVPARLFFDDEGLFPLFRRYKFTVEENTPLDQEVALDPELLGRDFREPVGCLQPRDQPKRPQGYGFLLHASWRRGVHGR